jgi:selT/selW/selH-like putative selenoprotein
MARYFQDVKNFIQSNPKYTAFIGNIHGDNYPPSSRAIIIANITSTLWFIGLIFIFMGDIIFRNLGVNQPEIYVLVKNNKITAFFLLFFLNSYGNSQFATGAFEVYINEILMFSKLQSGRLPGPEDIISMLKAAGY